MTFINFETNCCDQAQGDLESFKVVQKGGTSQNVQDDPQIASIRHWFRKILRPRDERDFEGNLAEPRECFNTSDGLDDQTTGPLQRWELEWTRTELAGQEHVANRVE